MIKKLTLAALTLILSVIFMSSSAYAATTTKCKPGSGKYNGQFWSWFELSQNNINNCDTKIKLYDSGRHFRAEWNMAKSWGEDAVGGMGWDNGGSNRIIGYNVGELTSNSDIQKAIVALYGWSCYKSGNTEYSQEYYVVETWKGPGQFVPWDESKGAPASSIKTYYRNGSNYKLYRLPRNGAQYCFNGNNRNFDQYWAVRQSPTEIGKNQTINFKKHSQEFNKQGFKLSGLKNGYQILAAEIFGDANRNHKGVIDASMWWKGWER